MIRNVKLSGSQSLFVVMGRTGEYGDKQEWFVAVYSHREEAEEHCKLANEFCKGSDCWDWDDRTNEKNPYDPNMLVYYTGTKYTIMEVPIFTNIADFLKHQEGV